MTAPLRPPRAGLTLTLHLLALAGWLYAVWSLLGWVAARDGRPPLSDAASHLDIYLRLKDVMDAAPDPLYRLYRLLYSGGPYPTVVPALTWVLAGDTPTVETARRAIHAFHLALAGGGWVMAHRLWGPGLAWVFTLLVGLSPLLLGYGTFQFIDLPLAAMVGLGFLALIGSDGFRRPGWSVAFGVLGGIGLLTKWTWGFYLGLPVAVVAAVALWRGLHGWRAWVGAAAVGAALGGAIGGASWWSLHHMGGWLTRHTGGFDSGAAALLGLRVYGVAALVGLVMVGVGWRVAREPRRASAGGVLCAVGCLCALAVPWYLEALPQLLDRVGHEERQMMGRTTAFRQMWAENVAVIGAAFPGIYGLVGAGGALALWRRRALPTVLLAVGGAATGVLLTSKILPLDPRYVLPAVPMLAAAAVAPWAGLGRFAGAFGGVVALLGAFAIGAEPASARWGWPALLSHTPHQPATGGLTHPARALGHTWQVLPPPRDEDFSALTALWADITTSCGDVRPCNVMLHANEDWWLQSRTLVVLARLDGRPWLRLQDWRGPALRHRSGPEHPEIPPLPSMLLLVPCSAHADEATSADEIRARITAATGLTPKPSRQYVIADCTVSLDTLD